MNAERITDQQLLAKFGSVEEEEVQSVEKPLLISSFDTANTLSPVPEAKELVILGWDSVQV